MPATLQDITGKKERLDAHRPLPASLVSNLNEWYKVELTYTSNAIEGNTLTRSETALVVEKGITVKGRSVKEHLEAINHAHAFDYIMGLAASTRSDLTKLDILNVHQLVLRSIDDSNAGQYHKQDVLISGSSYVPPSSFQVPGLMDEFFNWLVSENGDHPVKIAADAHFKLVTIHPFADGNGRTARLLMNLLLIQAGYPPAVIRKEDRAEYIDGLESAQLRSDFNQYYGLVYGAVDRSLDMYLKAMDPGKDSPFRMPEPTSKMLRIGELASLTGETAVSIRHWTEEGLLQVAYVTDSGYRYYHPSATDKVREIRRYQEQERLSIPEIRERFKTTSEAVTQTDMNGASNG